MVTMSTNLIDTALTVGSKLQVIGLVTQRSTQTVDDRPLTPSKPRRKTVSKSKYKKLHFVSLLRQSTIYILFVIAGENLRFHNSHSSPLVSDRRTTLIIIYEADDDVKCSHILHRIEYLRPHKPISGPISGRSAEIYTTDEWWLNICIHLGWHETFKASDLWDPETKKK